MVTVKVKKIPVRYNGTRYTKGQTFEMEKEHLAGIENLVELVPGDPPKGSSEGDGRLDSMTVEKLKEHATTLNIDLTGITKKADIIAAIQAAQAAQSGTQGEGND